MIDPSKVLVCTPTHSGEVDVNYAGGLASCAAAHLFGSMTFLASVSHVSLARDLMAHSFLRSPFDWMVFIDADIGFTSRDFRTLMDYPDSAATDLLKLNPEDVTLTEDGEALMVCAEYSRKIDSLDTASFGLGFTRIHRSVYEKLIAATDDSGTPRVGQFVHKGDLYNHFFPSGPGFEGVWFGEDTGFFHLCRLCGIVPRVEKRTRLVHYGRKAYPYG